MPSSKCTENHETSLLTCNDQVILHPSKTMSCGYSGGARVFEISNHERAPVHKSMFAISTLLTRYSPPISHLFCCKIIVRPGILTPAFPLPPNGIYRLAHSAYVMLHVCRHACRYICFFVCMLLRMHLCIYVSIFL